MGYVYLMRAGEHYKIGRAKDVDRRWRTFRTANPSITVEHVIRCKQDWVLEHELHQLFDRKRIDLEWFALHPGDVEYIKSLAGGVNWSPRRKHIHVGKLLGVVLRLSPHVIGLIVVLGAVYLYHNPQVMRVLKFPRFTAIQQVVVWAIAWLILLAFLLRRLKVRL